ncbi:hypothetical protein CONLIGDRAFT_651789 [Coniochaeta ligniaria NRRL 30616]|uniref:Erythromycin esterase n=1 Tax=Coniochaeta ligniaria NRRL 30616 TaxID=1408157 RepID=A0A1J7JYU6_9PEZI|nr:hypothetical protein CONLIGDRAFT_651789 [Coniochaeta ligniaria NRRL 30616]
MARRRSARLASAAKSPTPKPAPALSSLTEGDESVYEDAVPSIDAIVSSPAPKTPGQSSPIRPPMSEMHPSRAHHSMAPPSSGLRLGFSDINPATGSSNLPAVAQSTPTKIGTGLPSSDFTFRFTREAASDLKLGPEAQRIMADIREEAARIKADLKAKAEAEKQAEDETNGRKIAKPKGKAGRFSAAHMAEFKKMDSIENHPSAFRAQPGRFTPSTGLKRTQSKANLNDSETPRSKGKMFPPKPVAKANDEPESPVKRARQRIEDDTSSSRPISRDGSFIPRPKSSGNDISSINRSKSVASLMTPTKSSLARAAAAKTPMGSKIKSPSLLSGLKRSATTKTPGTGISRIVSPNITIRSPSGSRTFAKVRSMFRSDKTVVEKTKSSIPVMPGSTTSLALDKPLPSLPTATPAKATKHVVFTPQTKRVLETTQASPSPLKSGIPKSKIRQPLGEVRYPTLDTIMTGDDTTDDVSYPDLSSHKALPEPPVSAAKTTAAPGTFTFRSDKTISFGPTSPKGFGPSPGQSSVRQVRPSIAPTFSMPGSFPGPAPVCSTSPNKENEAPAMPSNIPTPTTTVFRALPHGMINKKRHRVSSDEEEAEQAAAERAAKKRRAESVPEGDALLAPRLMASGRKAAPTFSPAKRFGAPGTPSGVVASPSPRKKAGMSLSRLNMLARPKNRR